MGIFDDPSTMGLLGMAQGFSQAAMPSRMPVPLGAAIGMGAGGFQSGLQAGQAAQLQQQQLQAAQMQNQFTRAMLPAKMAAYQGAFGSGGQGVPGSMAGGMQQPQQSPGLFGRIGNALFGAPSPQGSAVTQTPLPPPPDTGQQAAQPQQAPSDPATATLAQMAQQQRFYALSGDGKSAEAAAGRIQSALAAGAVVGSDGVAYPIPHATQFAFQMKQADAAGTGAGGLPTQEALAGFNQGITQSNQTHQGQVDLGVAGGKAQIGIDAAGNTPGTYTPGAVVSTPNQLMGKTAGLTTPQGALASLPTPLLAPAVNALLKNGIPQSYWPTAVAQWKQESSLNPQNPGGLGNVLAPTAQGMGFDPSKLNDPAVGLDASAKYMRQMLDKNGGDPNKAVVAYNGGGDPNYLQHVQGRMQPSAPTTVPASPMVEEAKAEGTRLAGLPTDINKDAADAQQQIKLIDRTTAAMQAASAQGLPTGKFGPQLALATAAAKSLGINTDALGIKPEAVGNEQLAKEGLTQLSMQMMHKLFPGRITDTDINRVGVNLADYGMDPMALQGTMDTARAQAQYNLTKASDMNAYKAAHGTLAGWEPQFYGKSGYGPQFLQPLAQPSAAPTAQATAAAAPPSAPASTPAPAYPVPNLDAISWLNNHPETVAEFDHMYGPGTAAKYGIGP